MDSFDFDVDFSLENKVALITGAGLKRYIGPVKNNRFIIYFSHSLDNNYIFTNIKPQFFRNSRGCCYLFLPEHIISNFKTSCSHILIKTHQALDKVFRNLGCGDKSYFCFLFYKIAFIYKLLVCLPDNCAADIKNLPYFYFWENLLARLPIACFNLFNNILL